MIPSLLILPYLIRDTLHRWFIRLSSPLSRLCVVFFLSLCGLVFLSSYVISIKMLKERIRQNGADLIIGTHMEVPPHALPERHPDLIPQSVDQHRYYHFREAFVRAEHNGQGIAVVEYPTQLTASFPQARDQANATYLLPRVPDTYRGPTDTTIEHYTITAQSLADNDVPILRKLYPRGAVLVPTGCFEHLWNNGYLNKHVIQLTNITPDMVNFWTKTLQNISTLDKMDMGIISSAGLLKELDNMEQLQKKLRIGVTLGISSIICMLLICVSSMEFRQNEFIYALIGSFGVGRFLLYLMFIAENTVLVALGFSGALAGIWNIRSFITEKLYKAPDIALNLTELQTEIHIFLLAFVACILISSIPILFAIAKPIGNILK